MAGWDLNTPLLLTTAECNTEKGRCKTLNLNLCTVVVECRPVPGPGPSNPPVINLVVTRNPRRAVLGMLGHCTPRPHL